MLSHRFIDFDVDRAKQRHTVTYRVSPRFIAGIEYNPGADEIGPIANYTLAQESAKAPHLSLGTSSDRIGTPEGNQCYYLTVAKSFPNAKLSPYVSLNYSEFEDGLTLPFGVSYYVLPQLSAMYMNDGRRSHGLLTYMQSDWSVSLMWVWFKHPGISLSWGF